MVIEVKQNGKFVKIPYLTADVPVTEAPEDGKQYARQNAAWSEIIIPDVDLTEVNSKIAANTAAILTKVDKVEGKGLSTNDYSTVEKNKLAGIAEGAEVNVNADWNATEGDAQILNKPNVVIHQKDATGTVDLNTVLGYGMLSQTRDANATPEHNYPVTQAGLLIYGHSISERTNQIYGTYQSNRWFARSAGTPSHLPWKEFAFLENLPTVAKTGSYNDLTNKPTIPTVDVTKAYVDDKVTEINTALDTKADQATTYTKTEVDAIADTKADKSLVYTKTEIDQQVTEIDTTVSQALALKADKTDTYTKSEVDAKVASVYRFRGSVPTVDALPTTGVVIGDVYNIEADGSNWAAIAIADTITWDKLSETIDLTPYATKSEMNTAISTAVSPKLDTTTAAAMYVAKIDGKGLSTNDYTAADKAEVAKVANKVDKVSGKGLSTNDYTTDEKDKLTQLPYPSAIVTFPDLSNINFSLTIESNYLKVNSTNKTNIISYSTRFTLKNEGDYSVEIDSITYKLRAFLKNSSGYLYSIESTGLSDSLVNLSPGSVTTKGGNIAILGSADLDADTSSESVILIGTASLSVFSGVSYFYDVVVNSAPLHMPLARSTDPNLWYRNSVVLTQANYDELGSTKTSDNVLYFIPE